MKSTLALAALMLTAVAAPRPLAAVVQDGDTRLIHRYDPRHLEASRHEFAFDVKELWMDPRFQARFKESMLAETEIEPPLTQTEREIMMAFLEIRARPVEGETEEQRELAELENEREALELLEQERGEAVSAVFDYSVGQIHHRRGRKDLAKQAYLVAVEKYPRFRRAWQNLALVHVDSGEHAEAVKAFTRVLELGGGNAYTYGLLGFAYLETGNDISAESAYRQALILDAETPNWKLGLARSLFNQEQFPAAASLAGTLIAEDPERPDFWLLQANAYLNMKQPQRAAENLEIVDQLGGSTTASLGLLGDIYVNEGLFDLAAPAYLRAFEMAPASGVPSAIRAAQILAQRNEMEHTATIVARVEELVSDILTDEQRTELLKLNVRVAAAAGATEEQARILQEIVAIDPLDGDALIMLGDHSRDQGDVQQAEFYYERAASLEAFEARAQRLHGQLLVSVERYNEALPKLRRSYDLAPGESLREFIEQVEGVAAQNRGR